MPEPTLLYPDTAAIDAAIALSIEGGYLPAEYAGEAREAWRRRTRRPAREPELWIDEFEAGSDVNFLSLSEGDHVEHVELRIEGSGWPDRGPWPWPQRLIRLWLTDWRDLLPGHFTWV